METEIELTKDQDYDSIFVVVKETEINNNNIEKFSPYKVTETDGTEFKIPTSVEKGVPQCDICFRKFAGWAALYAHKGVENSLGKVWEDVGMVEKGRESGGKIVGKA